MESLPAEHDLCAEQAVLIGNRTYPAGFFCDVTDGLKPDTVFFSLGGLEYAVFFTEHLCEFALVCIAYLRGDLGGGQV